MIHIDMEMPVDCSVCFGRGAIWCRFDDSDRIVVPALPDESFEGRPEWCPLVEVPDMNVGNSCSEIPDGCENLQSTCNQLATERYEDLCEYFGNQEDPILTDRREFKRWLDRIKWHVKRVDELARRLESISCSEFPNSSDCISRQAAIDALKAIKYGLWEIDIPSPGNCLEYIEHHKQIKDMMEITDGWIKKLMKLPSAQPEQQWIPCREELPKENGVYLVYAPSYTGGSSSAKENYNGIMFSNYKNGKWSIEWGYYRRPDCVIAWMHLPEPYRGEQDE